jgi:hypothetical protein
MEYIELLERVGAPKAGSPVSQRVEWAARTRQFTHFAYYIKLVAPILVGILGSG